MPSQRRTANTAALIIFLGILTTACAGRNAGPGSIGDQEMGEPAWTGQLLSRGSLLISGSAQLRPSSDGKSMFVTVAIDTPPSQSLGLGWRLDRGLCSSSGQMVGRPGDYSPIVTQADGSGSSIASIGEPVPTSGIYSVRLFASVTPGSPLLACGDLLKR